MNLSAFQKILKKEGVELVFLVSPDSNIAYFTQSSFSHALLIIQPAASSLFISPLDKKPHASSISVKTFSKNWQKELTNHSLRRIGINKKSLSLEYFDKLRDMFPSAKFVDISGILQSLRSTKRMEEIDNIKKACSITADAFRQLTRELSLGKVGTEMEAAIVLENYIRLQSAEIAFPTIVASGKNSAVPHHITSKKKLQRGFLLLDFGAKYNNYCADMSRTLFLGTPTSQETNLYELLLRAQQEAIRKIKAGKKFVELEKACRDKLAAYSKHFIHSLGHGVGIDVHEEPFYRNNAVIGKNQVFTIEPGIYFPGKFGIRIEDTVWFNGKIDILTKSPKELIVLPFPKAK